LKKRVWPHLFRHSRATINAGFMSEKMLNALMGWRPESRQAGVYVHISGKDVDEAYLSHLGLMNGAGKEVAREEELRPIPCPRCGEPNQATEKLCFKCGSYLSLEQAIKSEEAKNSELEELKKQLGNLEKEVTSRKEVDETMNKLFSDPALVELVSKKIKEIRG
jgi:integrase/recombinase XerD